MPSTYDMNEDMLAIANNLSHLNIDVSGSVNQLVDKDIVKWYEDRFATLRADGVPEAIPLYLKKLQLRRDVNDITKTFIIMQSSQAM